MGNKIKSNIPLSKLQINKHDYIEDMTKYNENQDNCLICLELIAHPVHCLQCKSRFCRSCALKWNQKNKICPKKCSQLWKFDVVQSKGLKLKCPFYESCKSVTTPERFESHLRECKGLPEQAKQSAKLMNNYLCKKQHPLIFLSNGNHQLNLFERKCEQCGEQTICRSGCDKCKTFYCVKCRLPPLQRVICPKKTHQYKYTMKDTLYCDVCACNVSSLKKGYFNDEKCDFAICEFCYMNLPNLKQEGELLQKIRESLEKTEEDTRLFKFKKIFEEPKPRPDPKVISIEQRMRWRKNLKPGTKD